MESPDIKKYYVNMTEINLRVALINVSLAKRPATELIPMAIEAIGLQFRKVFELIAFASLAANRAQYSLTYRDFAEDWQAAKLLKNLQRVNPHFYPKPVIETPSGDLHVVALKDGDQDYLTQFD